MLAYSAHAATSAFHIIGQRYHKIAMGGAFSRRPPDPDFPGSGIPDYLPQPEYGNFPAGAS
jgi:hypothetical protein